MRTAVGCLLILGWAFLAAPAPGAETDAPAWLDSESPEVSFEIMKFRAPVVRLGADLPRLLERLGRRKLRLTEAGELLLVLSKLCWAATSI